MILDVLHLAEGTHGLVIVDKFPIHLVRHQEQVMLLDHVRDEGDLAWIKKAELLTLPMWEGDKIFLRLLDSDEPFFSLKLCYAGDRLESAVLNGKQVEL